MRPKYNGKRHELRGLGAHVFEKDGKMFVREMCSCGGCFDRTWEINEGDTVVSFRSMGLIGHLKNIRAISMMFRTTENTVLEHVELTAHSDAIDYYCGGQLFDNYGVDGGKSFAAGLIKSLEKDGIKVDTDVVLPAAARKDTHNDIR